MVVVDDEVPGAGRIGGLLIVLPPLERVAPADGFEAVADEPVVRFVVLLVVPLVVGRLGAAVVPFCGEAAVFFSLVALGLALDGLDLDASPSVWLISAADGTSGTGVCGAAGSGVAGSGAGTDSSVDAIILGR